VNLLEAQQRLQLPVDSLQAGIIGGAPASSELFKRIRDLLGFNDLMVSSQSRLFITSFVYHRAINITTLGNYFNALRSDLFEKSDYYYNKFSIIYTEHIWSHRNNSCSISIDTWRG